MPHRRPPWPHGERPPGISTVLADAAFGLLFLSRKFDGPVATAAGGAARPTTRNHPDRRIIKGEKRDAIFGQYGPVDLVAGGPPCRPWAMGGKARGYDDTRVLFPQAVASVSRHFPV